MENINDNLIITMMDRYTTLQHHHHALPQNIIMIMDRYNIIITII
jgi:hypothetical protein